MAPANISSRPDVLRLSLRRHFIKNYYQFCVTYDPPAPTKSGLEHAV